MGGLRCCAAETVRGLAELLGPGPTTRHPLFDAHALRIAGERAPPIVKPSKRGILTEGGRSASS